MKIDEREFWNERRIIILIVIFYAVLFLEYIGYSNSCFNMIALIICKYLMGLSFCSVYLGCLCQWAFQIYREYIKSKLTFHEWRQHISYNDYTTFVVLNCTLFVVPIYAIFLF
jgi:hypothetical protein